MTDFSLYKKCGGCNLVFLRENFFSNKARYDGLSGHCKKCHSVIAAKTTFEARQKALALHGGKCVSCGFDSDYRALQFDHVAGDGHALRMSPSTLFKDILSDKTGRYQILCANCNTIKAYANDERMKNKLFHPPVDIVLPDKQSLKGEERKLHTNYDQTGHAEKLEQWRENNPEKFEARNENISKARTGKKYPVNIEQEDI